MVAWLWLYTSDYMFRLDLNCIIDATRKGSMARYINHSCDVS